MHVKQHAIHEFAGGRAIVELVFDPKAVVWCTPLAKILVDDRAPRVRTASPVSRGTEPFRVVDARSGLVIWRFKAADWDDAEDETVRLCRLAGYRASQTRLEADQEPEEAILMVGCPKPIQRPSRAEIRERLLGPVVIRGR